MTQDIRNQLAVQQAFGNAGDEASDNQLDQNLVRPLGGGNWKWMQIVVTEAYTDLDSGARIVLRSDTANTMNTGNLREEASSPILLPARLTLGAIIEVPLPRGNPDLDVQRYIDAWMDVVSESATLGKLTIGIV